ncbi:daunorubicin resistance protein DrrA family ABC transporter ATP-binding protein [Actinospica robiniae]|uniref:daunorubicin resistance protein DrrA family ABC transporter ATP-binding protein n=1 Tax=Actinospica robiniae TaxID=304901 RepID=UPI00054F51CC|nr:daunorubicin resistance protein DrrA family ABC transporter ATP-binding protein [Actinospica robiniae]
MPSSTAVGELAIDARDLVKTYKGDVRAVRGVSLQVPRGSVFGLLGPNGAGKSTLVKMLTTLSAPTSGAASVAGFDIVRQQRQVRRSIGCIAQNSGVDVQATGRENLLLQGRVYGLRGAELERRVDDLLGRFGLAEVGGRFVKTYSGGMKRKLDVALGLVHAPQVLFLDEPTTGLDPEARSEMWEQIRALAWDQGLTILLTTHYLEEADELARSLAIVDQGRIVIEGSPDELKAELEGDAVSLELAQGADPDKALAVAGAPGRLTDVVVDGLLLRGRSGDGAGAVPALLAALEAVEITVASVTVARPSLDDVYLRHTGRSFTAAEEAAAQAARSGEQKGEAR